MSETGFRIQPAPRESVSGGRWSWTLGRLAGIELRVHATFVLLLAWLAFATYRATHSGSATLQSVAFILALFASVVLHELGHALTARRFGIGTREITLLPIGGVAQLERIPSEPRQELLVALAGPAVTVAIVIVLYVLMSLLGSRPLSLAEVRDPRASFFAQLLWANVVLALFNLLPAFPMDGGRVLRAALAMRMDYGRATQMAARVGKAFALIFGVVGLFVTANPFLVLIALFVWLGAASEASSAQLRSSLDGVRVRQVMITDVRSVSPSDLLSTAVSHLLSGFQEDLPVVENGQVVGVLTRSALVRGLHTIGPGAMVSDVMDRSFITASPDDPLDVAYSKLAACRCRTIPVTQGRSLLGLLISDNVAEYVVFRRAVG